MSDETNDQPTISDQYLEELQAIPRGKDLVARIIGIYEEETAPGESVVILSLGDKYGDWDVILDPTLVAYEAREKAAGRSPHSNYRTRVEALIDQEKLKVTSITSLPIPEDFRGDPFSRRKVIEEYLNNNKYPDQPLDTGTGLYRRVEKSREN